MNLLNEDLNDSALFCKSLIHKRKASASINPRNPKQLKLNFSIKTPKDDRIKQEMDDKSVEEENCSDSVNESGVISHYFLPKTTLNVCPLCMKSFKTDSAYSTHMKQCAKSHKMTTQQLLRALELQKKQLHLRSNFALSSRHVPASKKSDPKKREQKERDPYDLALGLALSESLSNCESRPETAQKSTLRQFGITSNHVTEPGKKRRDNARKCTLRVRTAEERQKIIIEKLGTILLEEEQAPETGNRRQSSNSSFLSEQLACLVNLGQELWNLGENDEKLDRYVDGANTSAMEDAGSERDGKESIPSGDLDSEISKLRLPREEVHDSWRKMVNRSEFSDVIGRTKDCQKFYLHSVVLFARFGEILEKDYESVFEKYNLSTVLIFLEYLYCGTLNSLIKAEMQNLLNLAIEFNYVDLIAILNCLEKNIAKCREISSHESANTEIEERTASENKKESFERDLFAEGNVVDLTQSSCDSAPNENDGNSSDTESYTEKCYRKFLQREKEIEELEEMQWEGERETREERMSVEGTSEMRAVLSEIEEEEDDGESAAEKIRDQPRRESDDSATRDLDDEFKMRHTEKNSDCIVLSSDSESHEPKNKDNVQTSPCSRTSPFDDYEIPYFDPYDNFHCFSEERFSPVAVHSQSLITGDLALRSPEPGAETPKTSPGVLQEEPAKNSEFCSTPVTMRPSLRMKSSMKSKSDKSRRRRSDLSASRILRKSLGLELKTKAARQRKAVTKRESLRRKDFAEALTDSIINELSKSVSLTPLRGKNFVEITPVPGKEEFGESDTPSPNYSNMEEALLKEHLSKYGLKKNLGKNKARKILRHIFEELHPLYNTETGKIVKVLSEDTPKTGKKAKPRAKPSNKNVKQKRNKDPRSKKTGDKELDSSKESSDGSTVTPERENYSHDTSGSDLENLSETLTQTVPSDPIDLPSAFGEFLANNPEYHEKILLYEPIWLEELQTKLKENFKKHFKISDLMDFLDQKCITFRSATQVRNAQKKLEKQKQRRKK